jgi:large subunit ribosomal protein L21
MFAVIKTGGKQYKVAANDVLKIEKLPAEPGTIVTFDKVLMVGEGDAVTLGSPLVEGAMVAAEFIGTKKQKTIIILKKHRRQHYDRRNGHRQLLSSVRITEILTGGAQPTIEPRAKAANAGTAEVSDAPAKPTRRSKAAQAAETAAPEASDEATVTLTEPVPTVAHDVETAEAAAAPKRSRKAAAPAETEAAEGDETKAKKPAARKAKPKAEEQE